MAKTVKTIADLLPDPANANRGTERGLRQLDASLRKYGAGRSILADKNGVVIAGNKTLDRAADIGLPVRVVQTDGTELVVVQRTDLDIDDDNARELAYADNVIAKNDLDFDPDRLLADVNRGINLEQFFLKDELDDILKQASGYGAPAEDPGADIDRAAELQEKWGTALGQLWQIGRHKLLCGDCTVRENVERVMQGEKAVLMFADPPYGVEYDAEWRGKAGHATLGKNRTGKVEADDRSDWTEAWKLFDSQVLYCWHASAYSDVVKQSLVDAGYDVRQQIIWAKTIPIMSRSAYHWQHEPCWYAVRHGSDGHWIGDRTQTTLWTEPPPNHIMAGSKDDKTEHPTQKPIALAKRAITNHVGPDDIVVDPFLGSGTTLVACEQLGRSGRGLELSPAYCAVILERMSGLGLAPELLSA